MSFSMTARLPMEHELKITPQFFDAVNSGAKPFEVRVADRDYRYSDVLYLREYDPSGMDKVLDRNPYSGRFCKKVITYVLDDSRFVKEGYVILGIQQLGWL
jgi:hypothetical protein